MSELSKYGLKVDLDPETMSVVFIVRERNDKGELEEITRKSYPYSDVHPDLDALTKLYGLSKLYQDRTSDKKVSEYGEQKLTFIDEVRDQINEGKWERERTAGSPTVSAEVEALAELKNCSVADIQKSLRKYTKEQKEKVFSNPTVVAKAAEIKSARESQIDIDMDDFLAA